METFHSDRDPLFHALVANRSKFDNRAYAAPQGAGFGLNLDEAVIARYRVKLNRERLSFDGLSTSTKKRRRRRTCGWLAHKS